MFEKLRLSKSKSKEKYLTMKSGEIIEEDKNYRKELHETYRLNKETNSTLTEKPSVEKNKEFLKGLAPDDDLSDTEKLKEMEKSKGLAYDENETEEQIQGTLRFNGNKLLQWASYIGILMILISGTYMAGSFALDTMTKQNNNIKLPSFGEKGEKELVQDEDGWLSMLLSKLSPKKQATPDKKTESTVDPSTLVLAELTLSGEIHNDIVKNFNNIAETSNDYLKYQKRRVELAGVIGESKASSIKNRIKVATLKNEEIKEMLTVRLDNLDSLVTDLDGVSRINLEKKANQFLIDEESNNQGTKLLFKTTLEKNHIPFTEEGDEINF